MTLHDLTLPRNAESAYDAAARHFDAPAVSFWSRHGHAASIHQRGRKVQIGSCIRWGQHQSTDAGWVNLGCKGCIAGYPRVHPNCATAGEDQA